MSIELIHGDSLQELRKMKAGQFDICLTDPPYSSGANESMRLGGTREKKKGGTWFPSDKMGTAGISHLMREFAVEMHRVLERDAHLLMFTDWRMIVFFVPIIESAGFQYKNLIVWNKKAVGLGVGFRPQHELVLCFEKGSPHKANGGTSNLLSHNRPGNDKLHPTQKPEALLVEILNPISKDGSRVIDPFAGSASTAAACLRLGLDCTCIELDEAIHKASVKRIKSLV